jgi:hypothetical protein
MDGVGKAFVVYSLGEKADGDARRNRVDGKMERKGFMSEII